MVRSLGRSAPTRKIAAATLAGRYRSPATEAMLDILAEVADRFELPAGTARRRLTEPSSDSGRNRGMSPRALLPIPRPAGAPCRPLASATGAAEGPRGRARRVVAAAGAEGGDVAYLTRDGRRATRLLERGRIGGVTLRGSACRAPSRVPAVAYDGSPSGLSADGRTLVLIEPADALPAREHDVRGIDARRMQPAPQDPPARRLQLRRDLAGRASHVPDPVPLAARRDRYAVRAYDMRARRLFPAAGRRSARAGRGDERGAAVTRDGRERPLGVHALQRPQAPVRARARHRTAHGGRASTST